MHPQKVTCVLPRLKKMDQLKPVQEISSDDSYQQASASEQSSSSEEGSSSTVTDHLAKLPEAKRAAVSDLFRERGNPRKVRRVSGGPSTTMKRVASYERLKDFKGEYLSTSMGSLYCDACHVTLSTKKSIIKKTTFVQTIMNERRKKWRRNELVS